MGVQRFTNHFSAVDLVGYGGAQTTSHIARTAGTPLGAAGRSRDSNALTLSAASPVGLASEMAERIEGEQPPPKRGVNLFALPQRATSRSDGELVETMRMSRAGCCWCVHVAATRTTMNIHDDQSLWRQRRIIDEHDGASPWRLVGRPREQVDKFDVTCPSLDQSLKQRELADDDKFAARKLRKSDQRRLGQAAGRRVVVGPAPAIVSGVRASHRLRLVALELELASCQDCSRFGQARKTQPPPPLRQSSGMHLVVAAADIFLAHLAGLRCSTGQVAQ